MESYQSIYEMWRLEIERRLILCSFWVKGKYYVLTSNHHTIHDIYVVIHKQISFLIYMVVKKWFSKWPVRASEHDLHKWTQSPLQIKKDI